MDLSQINRDVIKEAAETYGTPLYFYDLDRMQANVDLLRANCSSFKLRYAVKTNPNPYIIEQMKNWVDSMDVSSSGEVVHVCEKGWHGADVAFTGPAKDRKDLEIALDNQVRSIVIESMDEARLLNAVAAERGLTARILIRIAPALAEKNFGIRLAGRPTQFGIDEDKLEESFSEMRTLNHLSLEGFHIYSGSQCLDDESLAEHFTNMWAIFKQTLGLWGGAVNELVFGAGMGIPYHDNETELALSHLKPAIEAIENELKSYSPIDCFIELGRFIVGTGGLFVTEVVRVKESRGSNIAICNGGMNHNLGACGHLGGVSHRHYSMVNVSNTESDVERYRVVGPLCTAIDTLAHRIELPRLKAGDLIAVGCSGSYGPSASPLLFISHGLPQEIAFRSEPRQFFDMNWINQL